MATQIVIKNSAVAGKVPSESDLAVGELALNLKDKKLFSKDADGNVFSVTADDPSGDYVKLDDAGTAQSIVGGGGIDLAGPLDVDGKVRINSDSVLNREGLAVNGDIGFNAQNYTFRLFRSDDLASTDYTFLGLSTGSSDFEIRKSGGWGTRVYMYVDTSNRIHLSNDNNSGSPNLIGTTTAMVHAHGGLNAEFGTDTAQLGNVAPMNDWSCYPARA